MRKVGFDLFNSMITRNRQFDNLIRTNSHEIEFIYIASKVDLTSSNTTIWGVDPGVNDVYVTSDGGIGTHRIRRTSQSEYYGICGYNSATRRRKPHAENYNIVINIQTLKIINLQQFI
ncbi:MAG: hypothetical protein EXX96DRAFT_612251 [Benjaminiella poitrasii]|nr:MAG: hypothetical protein EXX96DRAFT_612251 [Benjaminiella poitrasii]